MAIPLVVEGLIYTGECTGTKLDSPQGVAWLESVGSFRFEPARGKACTIRREPSGYWYGCRKVAGKVRKKYVGKSSEISTAKLKEIAEALEVPPVPRVAQVAEVAQEVAEVTQVADKVAQDRLTVLELEVANLRKALEALQEALPGKFEVGDSEELPKVNDKVAERLQNELSNLKAENETLCRSLAKNDTLINLRNQEIAALNSRLAAKDETIAKAGEQFDKLDQEVTQIRSQLEQERADREEIEAELAELKQKSATASKNLPEAADILNQLKAKRKKSKTDLADLEAILEILES